MAGGPLLDATHDRDNVEVNGGNGNHHAEGMSLA